MLRGSHSATVDAKGRVKVPAAFRGPIVDDYGTEVFVTSVDGNNVRVYPLPIWERVEQRLGEIPAMTPARQKFLARVNYFGQMATMDKQGRILVPLLLREEARITGEVVVMGQMDYLEIWNHEAFRQRLAREVFDEDDHQALAGLGI